MSPLSRRFDEAFAYAHDVHADHTRKGNGAPYIGHLMGVASIVIDDGGTEDEAIAALLHDAPEDRGGRERLDDIRARFGDTVATIVEDCTDSWTMPKAPWAERKKKYAEHARTLSPSSLTFGTVATKGSGAAVAATSPVSLGASATARTGKRTVKMDPLPGPSL